MIKKALLDEAIAKVRGMLPGQKDQPNTPLRTGIGAGIGAAAGALPVAMGRNIPEGASGVESAKKMIKLLLAAKGKPAAVIGGAAALGGAAGLGSGLLSKHSSVYRQGFEAKCAEAGMSDLQTKQAYIGAVVGAARALAPGLLRSARTWGPKLMQKLRSLGRSFGQARSGMPTNIDKALHPGALNSMFRGAGKYTRNIGEDLGPALTWAKQHPIYAGGAGAGLMGAGGGIQPMLGDEG